MECSRGREYVLTELKTPERDFFTTIQVRGGVIPVCPVRATQPIPKERVKEANLALAKIKIRAPIKAGQVVAEDLLGLGVNVVSTRDIAKARDKRNG